ncbi:MAG: universal stress protein [Desulfohalobiaceae bacterium]|nr:universal stress protein [Desulfohalobiaceae bacterium]
MLKKAVLPLSLKEPRHKLHHMAQCMLYFGTETLFLVHIMSQEDYGKQGTIQKNMRDIADGMRELGLHVEMYFKSGRIADAVCQAALDLEADYLSLHWRKKNVIKQTLLGSADADILRMCSLPVFIYQSRGHLERKTSLHRVLYATDFRHTDSAVMPYLQNRDFRAETLYLLHVGERAPDPHAEEERRQESMRNLQRLARECSHAFTTVETVEVVGSVKWQIMRQAKKRKADLIIVGKSKKARPLEQMLGSVAETLPDRTACSLFIVSDIHKG